MLKLQSIFLRKKTKHHIIYFLLVFSALFGSCTGFSELEVGEVRDVNIKGFQDNSLLVGVRVPVTNPSSYKITVLELDSKVYVNNQYLGKVTSLENVVLPSKSDDIYELTFSVRVANIFGTALTVMKFKPGQQVEIRLEGMLTARSMLVKKKIPINETRKVVL